MNQTKRTTLNAPAVVQRVKPKHIEDMGEETKQLHELISSGKAYLTVVAYPWGVEFDVCEGVSSE